MNPPTQGVLLAAVGGYLDTLGFIMLSGLFVNHVTGNIVLAVADPGWSSVPEIVMFPVFFAMVGFGTALAGKVADIRPALAAETAFLGLFLLLGVTLVREPGAGNLVAQILVGAAGVSAMAIQTAITRLAGHAFPTNMVTGTMTMLGMDSARLVLRLDGTDAERAASRRRARLHARVVLGFGAGAALAAVATPAIHFWAALVPFLVIGSLLTHTKETQPGQTSRATTTSA